MKKLASFVLALCLLLGVGASAEMVNTESAMPVVTEPFEVDIAFVPQSAAVDFKIENNAMAAMRKNKFRIQQDASKERNSSTSRSVSSAVRAL